MGALTTTGVRVANLNPGADVLATMQRIACAGCSIDAAGTQWDVRVAVCGTPAATIDCANSGSTVRMLLGVCAGANLAADSTAMRRCDAARWNPSARSYARSARGSRRAEGRLPLRVARIGRGPDARLHSPRDLRRR